MKATIKPTMLLAIEAAPVKGKAAKSKGKAAPATPVATAEYKESTPAERNMRGAHGSKVNATRDWVDGRITNKQHADIHKRAEKVLRQKGCM